MPRRANKLANIFLEFGNKQQAAPSPQLQQLRARHHHHHSCWAQKLQRLVPFVDLETQLMVASAGHLATDTSPLPLPQQWLLITSLLKLESKAPIDIDKGGDIEGKELV